MLVLVLTSLLLGFHFFSVPYAPSANPEHDLHTLTLSDPALGQALADCDQGSVSGLTTWLNRAELEDREHIARLLLALCDPKHTDQFDTHLCWQYRNRFRAFIDLTTGKDRLDGQIDNLLAYTLATGETAAYKPDEADINLARSLEPRLKRDANEDKDPNLEDTIGCIEFQARNYAGAKDAFQLSVTYFAQLHDAGAAKAAMLEQRRLEASTRNEQAMTDHKGPDPIADSELQPLPPDVVLAGTPTPPAKP